MNINLTLFAQLIAFAVFVGFCMRYVWPPITKALQERTAKIAEGLAAAERGQQEQELGRQRALEVIELSGRPLSDLHDEQEAAGPDCRVLRVVACPQPRAVLHQRIEQRFDAMLAAGFLARAGAPWRWSPTSTTSS